MMTKDASILHGKTVLVVEDQYLNAMEVRRLIGTLGGDTLGPAANVAKARELLAGTTPDFAVLDINLSDEPVFPLAKALREAGVPFVFVSGYEDFMVPEAYRDVSRLTKPLAAGDLIAAVRRHLPA